ncbi:hypothetical protein H311_05154, partial [Anncaliia algerae PRA109]
ENPSYTIYSYSNEPPLHTYNTDDSAYTDGLYDDETIIKDIEDNKNCTAYEKKNESQKEIIDKDIYTFYPPKIIKNCINKIKIPYGEIVYPVYEKPLDSISEDLKKEILNKDEKLSHGEIIYVADQETT